MSTRNADRERPTTGMAIKVGTESKRGYVKTKLGNVVVSARKPSKDIVEENVSRSTKALKRLSKRLVTKSGVYIPERKGVPRYSADENNPKFIIRRLDGNTSRGEFVGGHFVEVK